MFKKVMTEIKKDKYFVFTSFSTFIVNVEGSYNFDQTCNVCLRQKEDFASV